MRYRALACDYDGTLAHDGRVNAATVESLKTFLATGRRLILVTGRELPELLGIFPEIGLFEWVVAENGALLYRPSTSEERPLGDAPSEAFITALQSKGVAPMSVGRVIVATWEPFETVVIETIRNLSLELQVIFNKGAVMILPTGINKASGLSAALKEMSLSPHNVVGVGDAENDHALLRSCEFSCAVANALPALKETADFVAGRDHGAGVGELIERIVADDLGSLEVPSSRYRPAFGHEGEGDAAEAVTLPPYGHNILIYGPSASGKSTVATRFVESLLDQKYQFCLIDPEGDYSGLENVTVFGGPKLVFSEEEVLRRMEDPAANVVVSLTGLPIPDRPPAFLSLLSKLLQLRSRTGRPHWIVMDEAHHLLPADWQPPEGMLPEEIRNLMFVTVHPELLSPTLLERIDTVVAVGPGARESLRVFAHRQGLAVPAISSQGTEAESHELASGEVWLWMPREAGAPRRVRVDPCRTERLRHSRKYAEGELPPDRSFYFQGVEGRMNLRAQNLMLFLQIGEGVDDETWKFHLRRGDYERWFRESIKDETLAAAAARVASLPSVDAAASRKLIRQAVEESYTVPASGVLPVPGAS